MAFICERDLSIETVAAYLSQQGVTHSIDDDGDIYVSDREAGFPFWLYIDRPYKVLVFYTFISCGSFERAESALEEAQRVRLGPITPRFFLNDNELHAQFFMSFRDGVVDTHIYDAACRFAEYFSVARREGLSISERRALH
jgi:hypothetical protein